jgi:hypothetical protein
MSNFLLRLKESYDNLLTFSFNNNNNNRHSPKGGDEYYDYDYYY